MFTIHPFHSTPRLLFYMMLLLFTFISGSCKKDNSPGGGHANPGEDPLKPAADITTTLIVQVVDERGEPLSDVTITAHGASGISSHTGTYAFKDINVPGNRCVVLGEKEGYFEASRAETPEESGTTEIRLVMMSKTVMHILNAASGGKASLTN